MSDNISVSLVLGSGGARGLAHIGVIHWLEEHQFDIQSISGSSVGALIGGIYAAGKLDEFETWVTGLSKSEIFKLLDISWTSSGLVKGDKIFSHLHSLVGDITIEDLDMRFTAVASDIAQEKEVWIQSGKLMDAMRASVSLPLFFTPFDYHGTPLLDGGLLNPVPIAPTLSDKTNLTLAVNLGGKNAAQPTHASTTKKEKKEHHSIKDKLLVAGEDFIAKLSPSAASNLDFLNITNQSFDAMQSAISRQKIASHPPDHVLEIARNAAGILEFHRAQELIDLGYQKAEEAFGDIKQAQ